MCVKACNLGGVETKITTGNITGTEHIWTYSDLFPLCIFQPVISGCLSYVMTCPCTETFGTVLKGPSVLQVPCYHHTFDLLSFHLLSNMGIKPGTLHFPVQAPTPLNVWTVRGCRREPIWVNMETQFYTTIYSYQIYPSVCIGAGLPPVGDQLILQVILLKQNGVRKNIKTFSTPYWVGKRLQMQIHWGQIEIALKHGWNPGFCVWKKHSVNTLFYSSYCTAHHFCCIFIILVLHLIRFSLPFTAF